MKYSSVEVRNMSYQEWMETIAKELNTAGYKTKGVGSTLLDYEVYESETFFMGSINDPNAMEYLKRIGLVNNGRCPMCGRPINGNPGRFTDGFNSNLHFQICQSCVNEGKRISVNPNNTGCMLALLTIPWHLIRNLF